MVAAPGPGGPKERVWVAKGKQPHFHDDRAIDQLMAMVTALTAEVAILRDRLDTNERIAEGRKLYSRSDVDSFIPDAPIMAERSAQHQRLLRKVFRVLKEDLARYDSPADEAELERLANEINAA
jgi:D-alanine-D-alanine ligase-like ATP-grasp enzyme